MVPGDRQNREVMTRHVEVIGRPRRAQCRTIVTYASSDPLSTSVLFIGR